MPTTINASNTTGGAVVTGDGSGILELQSGGVTGITVNGPNVTVAGTLTATGGIPAITTALTSPVSITGNSTAGAEIRLPEDTDNGTNYVAIKAPNALAANVTFTLPTADGTNGQYLRTDGAGNLSFATVPVTSPGGTTGQIQINNAGAFGAVASGTSGQVLVSQGAGNAPTWSTNPFGATELYSVMTAGYTARVASPASITTGTFYSSVPMPSAALASGTNNTSYCPVWSKYYSCWFSLGYPDNSTSFWNIYYSLDGINWTTYIFELNPKIGSPGNYNPGPGAGYANLIIDDSNGRMWTIYANSTTINPYYRNANTGMDSNWTAASTISLPNGATYYGARYVDTGDSATSAIVLLCTNNSQDNRLYTCDAGGTTFTLRVTGSTPNSSNQPTSFTIDSVTARAAILYESQPHCMYMTTNNARTGWAYNTNYGGGSGSGTQCTIGVGGGYYVTASGSQGSSNLYYSATGAGTWTTITNPCGGNTIQRVMYVNGVWYATTLNGMYKTSQNPPTTGWTQMNPSPRLLGVVNIRTQA